MNIYEKIKEEVTQIKDEIISIRRQIHRFPELSFQEFKTTEFIKEKLIAYNIEYVLLEGTGIIGIIGKGDKSILLRADIDALPIQETTGFEFSSKIDGVMHACGHDMHTAMLLGAGKILKKYEDRINGKILLLFQPAEELLPGGAKIVIESGVLDKFKVISAFGQHINPFIDKGKIVVNSGPFMASTDELYWTIKGQSYHAAQPDAGTNTILPATAIVQSLQNIQYINRDPFNISVISITAINGGNTANVFPETVEMKGTLRCYSNSLREKMHKLLLEKSKLICDLYGAKCFLEIRQGYPVLINNKEMVEYVQNTAIQLYGKDCLQESKGVLWGEDFAYYSKKFPSCFWFLGTKDIGCENIYPLHNPKLSPSEDSLLIGTALLSSIGLKFFSR